MPVTRGRLVGDHPGDPSNRDRARAEPVEQRVPADRSAHARSERDRSLAGAVLAGDGRRAPGGLGRVSTSPSGWMLAVGDTLVFDIGGQRVEAPVTSIRKEERRVADALDRWPDRTSSFRPGTLAALPHTFVGGAKGPPTRRRGPRGCRTASCRRFRASRSSTRSTTSRRSAQRVADVSRAVSLLGGFVLVCGVADPGGLGRDDEDAPALRSRRCSRRSARNGACSSCITIDRIRACSARWPASSARRPRSR